MKLYMHPVSSPSRAIMLFAAESGIDLDCQVVDLLAGEHLAEEFATINCNHLVPVLEDGDFRLSESSAILKYLADKVHSPAYPADLQERARVNELMDWFNVNFYRDLGYGLVYPQIFPNHHRRSEEGTAAAVARGQKRTHHWLGILDSAIIGPDQDFVCLGRITIADYIGACLVTVGDLIQFDMSSYSNICRWLDGMRSLDSWPRVNEGFEEYVTAFSGKTYVAA